MYSEFVNGLHFLSVIAAATNWVYKNFKIKIKNG